MMICLKGVVLAKRRRELLLRAEHGPVLSLIGAESRDGTRIRRRAALGLERHGLARTYIAPGRDESGARRQRLLHLELTPLGRALVAVARDRLKSGRQMRWRELEPKLAAAMA